MLTPAQIRGHRFAPAVRGAYKAEEVDAFFAEVLESYEKALNDNGELLKRISLLAERVEAYRNDEDNIKVALLTAQRMADKMVKDANETAAEQLKSAAEKLAYAEAQATAQAKMLIEKAQKEADDKTLNAEIEADRLVKDARTEAAEMRRTATQEAQEQLAAVREDVRMETILLASLRREAEEFKNALIQLYNKHLSLIDSMPGEVAQTAPTPFAPPTVPETVVEEPAEDPFKFFSTPTPAAELRYAEEEAEKEAEEEVKGEVKGEVKETPFAQEEAQTEEEVVEDEPTAFEVPAFDESESRTDASPITTEDIESLFSQVDSPPALSETEAQSTQEEANEEASALFVLESDTPKREDESEDPADEPAETNDTEDADKEDDDDEGSSPESYNTDDDDAFGFLDDDDEGRSDDGFKLDLDDLESDDAEDSEGEDEGPSPKSVFEAIEYDEDDDDDSQPRFRGFFKK